MKCDKCGYENYDEAYLCRNCGMEMNKSKKRRVQKKKDERTASLVNEALDNIELTPVEDEDESEKSHSDYTNYGDYNYNASAFYQPPDDYTEPAKGGAKPIIITAVIIIALLAAATAGMYLYFFNPQLINSLF